jgi:hypothetical protein
MLKIIRLQTQYNLHSKTYDLFFLESQAMSSLTKLLSKIIIILN